MNCEFNLLHHVGGVAKRVCAAAAAAAAAAETAHEGDDNTPSGPTGRGVKNGMFCHGILIVFNTVQRHELYLGMALYKNR